MRLVEIAKGEAVNPEQVIRVYQEAKQVYVVLTEIKIGEAVQMSPEDYPRICAKSKKVKSNYDYQETLSRLIGKFGPG